MIIFKRLTRNQKQVFFSVLFFIFSVSGYFFWKCLPEPLFNTPFSRVLLDRDGELMGAFIARDEQWRFPPKPEIPEKFISAATCYEDRRFFYHPGVDFFAVARAMWSNIRSGRIVSGASTITMQVIRLSRRGQARTFREKLTEMILAFRLEIAMSKKEIFSLYASHAPFGGNVVGIQAGAWRYFGRGPEQLSWAETAMLAVLPNNPALIHPGRNRKKLRQKRDWLLDKMEQRGITDSMSCRLAKAEPLPSKPHPIPMLAPHLPDKLIAAGNRQTATQIRTTLKKDIQIRTNEIIRRHHRILAGNGIFNAAALILEVETGDVLAYVGNVADFTNPKHGNHVDVITAPRSTGSILKPFLFAGIINAGEILQSQLVHDIPTQIGGFAPENYTRDYQGAVPAYMALARSLNIPAVRMLRSFGTDRFYNLLKQLGMTTLHRPAREYGLSLILGGAEGTLWDITGIYASMARHVNRYSDVGRETPVFFPPKFITDGLTVDSSKITPSQFVQNTTKEAYPQLGGVTEDSPLEGGQGGVVRIRTDGYARGKHPPGPPQGGNPLTYGYARMKNNPLKAAACWLTFQAMLEVVRPGEESAWKDFASYRRIAWKTGTSYGLRDGWAVGVTPKYAAGVWVGNADGEGRPGLTGIDAAAPILFEIFGLLDVREWFDIPEADLVEISVCSKSGYRVGPFCAETREIQIMQTGLRSKSCPYCRIIHCDSELRWRVHSECERVADIRSEKWFVLPPGPEWYYRKKHSDYRLLPRLRDDCSESAGTDTVSLTLIIPRQNSRIYVPRELDSRIGRTVFKAAHREPRTIVYWHLDETYLGQTRDIHQMALAPDPGKHTLTLVDENGERLERRFTVLE
ncbi:MAG: penicillin-binding protein 1C [Desulfobacterales bacterium]|nr:penicillin-binding protein 1C [Desulfobacterales bacterium]